METVGAAYISIDNGTLGCEGNHRKVWQWLNDHATTKWVVVLEDDAPQDLNMRDSARVEKRGPSIVTTVPLR
jgi:hypothetical protein